MKLHLLLLAIISTVIPSHGKNEPQAEQTSVEQRVEEPAPGEVKPEKSMPPSDKVEEREVDPFAPAESWPKLAAQPTQEAADEKERFPIPADQRKGTGPRLVVGKIRGEEVQMTFLNDSDKTLHLYGGGLHSPFYTPEIFRDGEWTYAPNHMNCGTGARDSILPAGHGFHFQVSLPLAPTPFRLSMSAEAEKENK